MKIYMVSLLHRVTIINTDDDDDDDDDVGV